MPQPRYQQISLQDTLYYHCVSRCVRRAFLCGKDSYTKKNFDYRRGWFTQRLFSLRQTFMIDVAAYAVLSNHYHLVLYINLKQAAALDDKAVVRRWHANFAGTLLSHRFEAEEPLSEHETLSLKAQIATWRDRLTSISWFMRSMNEHIARLANAEDKCKGRFWEARFSSQALLDDKALLSCMTYVDLNPVRAGLASSLEGSKHTSIAKRLAFDKAMQHITPPSQPPELLPFLQQDQPNEHSLPLSLKEYTSLLEWTGSAIRDNKFSLLQPPSALSKLNFDGETWLALLQGFGHLFKSLIGSLSALTASCRHVGFVRRPGASPCKKYFKDD